MTTGYKIKDVVDRSGFTAATLRYYEEIGLLPRSTRTPAGYRLYDDHTLARLAFIARAKQLGCTLDEIADLAVAWDGGQCGPVQDRLRNVVAGKLDRAQEQIVQLMKLTSELQRAATSLEMHRPEGPCDDRCGCVTDDAAETPTDHPVSLVAKPNDGETIACTLGAESMQGRLDEWASLLHHVQRRDDIDTGVRLTFGPTTPLDELILLTVAEHSCCQFFNFAITVDGRGIALEVRAPTDALAIVDTLFGTPA